MPTVPDMVLPSTINEVILSMSDVESREKLYDAGLNVKDVALVKTSCRRNCKNKARQPRGKDPDNKNDERNGKEKTTSSPVCHSKEKHEEPLVGLHRQRALEKGHFRKDKHRSFRIRIYTKRSRAETI